MLVLVQPVAVGVGVPVQVPLVQTGFCRHRSVSVHVFALFAVWTHPFVGSHVSSVHGLLSSQLTGVGVPQAPVVGSQLTVVHALEAAHGGVPTWQRLVVVLHVSVPLQGLPSLQVALLRQNGSHELSGFGSGT